MKRGTMQHTIVISPRNTTNKLNIVRSHQRSVFKLEDSPARRELARGQLSIARSDGECTGKMGDGESC